MCLLVKRLSTARLPDRCTTAFVVRKYSSRPVSEWKSRWSARSAGSGKGAR
jgi:hypothetical protein